jgi:hypothetical protein
LRQGNLLHNQAAWTGHDKRYTEGEGTMERRFTALRLVGTVFKVLAWIWLIVGFLVAIGLLVLSFVLPGQDIGLGVEWGGALAGIAMFVTSIVITAVYFLVLYGIGESIYLFLAVEENTRRTAYFVQQQYTAQSSAFGSSQQPSDYPE